MHVYAQLAAAEAGHWWFRARNRVLLWALAEKVGKFGCFLEIGCGTGFVLEAIHRAYPEARLCGSDYFDEALAIAHARVPTADLCRIDATTMQDRERYDVIGAFDVIEHIDQDESALHNMARALRQGGRLMLTVPQHQWLWSSYDVQSGHVRRYSRGEIVSKLRYAGLHVGYVGSFVGLLLPFMWMARMSRRTRASDILSEFRIPYLLNVSLEAVMTAEFALLRLGFRLPIGGSLLVVATKTTPAI